MRIIEVWAENVRGIADKKVINPASSGVTLVHAPNESGKTTLSEVLSLLFTYATNSTDTFIKSLQPVGKDVGPSMGATIQIGEDTYVIRKQWIKDKKTEVEIIGPHKAQLQSTAAQKEIERIFKEAINPNFWSLLQFPQAKFNELVDQKFNNDFLKALETLLGDITSDSEEESADELLKSVEKEYQKWFTATGRFATAEGTQGKFLNDLEEQLDSARNSEEELARKIIEFQEIEVAADKDRSNLEYLNTVFEAQQLKSSIDAVARELNTYNRHKNAILEIEEKWPALSNFKETDFEALKSLHSLELQYSALTFLTLNAISAGNVEVQGEDLALAKGESKDIPLEPGLRIVVPGLLEISYKSDDGNQTPNLAEAHKRYHEILTLMKVSNFSEADALNRAFQERKIQVDQLSKLEIEKNSAGIEVALSDLQKVATGYPNWTELISAEEVTVNELKVLAREDGKAEGRWIEINKQGWDHELNKLRSEIQTRESSVARLILQRSAIEVLFKTLKKNREGAAKAMAPVFALKFNEIAKAFFGENVDFYINDQFKIESRYRNGSSVPIANLSTGAKEQLAILMRFTISRLVQSASDSNTSVPVFLDDEFGHTDPMRLKEMANVFKNLGSDQQFILMTCYPDKFDDFEIAKKIDLLA